MRAVFRQDIHGIENGGFHIFGQLFDQLGGFGHFVIFGFINTVIRVRRNNARDGIIERCAAGVHIRPCSLMTAGGILLHRCIAELQNHGKTAAVGRRNETRRTKVNQLDLAVVTDEHVVRSNISVNDTCLMHHIQRVKHLNHNIDGFIIGDLSLFLDEIAQRFAIKILHDNISGTVLGEAVKYADDSGNGVELGKAAGLIEKTLHALLEFFRAVPIVNFDSGITDRSGCKVAGEVLFDGNFLFQQRIPRHVGHAEAAVSERLADNVTSFQNGSKRKMILVFLILPFTKATVRTGGNAVFIFLHATDTSFFHRRDLLVF